MIRQFRPADAPLCCQLIHACLENDHSLSPALREKMMRAEIPAVVEERARLFYLAVYEHEGQILGMAGLDLNEIRILCVSPPHQRQGIGRALFDHVRAMVPGMLFKDIFVYSSPSAIGFYRACGFVENGHYFYDFDGLSIPTIFLTFSIQK